MERDAVRTLRPAGRRLLSFLSRALPRWRFTAVDPSGAMIEVCRQRAAVEGFLDRCRFHAGYIDSLPADEPHDAATCFPGFAVPARPRRAHHPLPRLAAHLRPDGLLASTDHASDTSSAAYDALLPPWFTMMATGGLDAEKLQRMRANYARDVAILPPPTGGVDRRRRGIHTSRAIFPGRIDPRLVRKEYPMTARRFQEADQPYARAFECVEQGELPRAGR